MARLTSGLVQRKAQVPLFAEVADALGAVDRGSTMHQLFSGHGAPMPLSPLTSQPIVVLDQEPSTAIAYALGSDSYRTQMQELVGSGYDFATMTEDQLIQRSMQLASRPGVAQQPPPPQQQQHQPQHQQEQQVDSEQQQQQQLEQGQQPEQPPSQQQPQQPQPHQAAALQHAQPIKVTFESTLPNVQYRCEVTIYYPLRFAALRKLFCGGDAAFIYSMARSQSWEVRNASREGRRERARGSSRLFVCVQAKEQGGGASKAKFVNTMDGLYLLKVRHSHHRFAV